MDNIKIDMENMEELLVQMLEKAKTDRKALRSLKSAAVCCQQYSLAANLRQIENELFPETEEIKQAKERAENLYLLFRMVELNIPKDVCWLIGETVKGYTKKKDGFSLKDACKLIVKREQLFGDGE